MEQINQQVIDTDNEAIEILYDASIDKSMGGLGGCKQFNINDYPVKYHSLILDYINDKIDTVTAIYIVMKQAEKDLLK